jgi:hypothetical protein
MSERTIRPRDRDAILQSLSAGVVPRRGLQYIQVGRAGEVKALLQDLDRVADGGGAIRLIIGEYGSGKTFFEQLIRMAALEKNLVTMHADFNPDRRLHGSNGQARSLYAELTRNMATRSSPEGGAIGAVVEKFISTTMDFARQNDTNVPAEMRRRMSRLSELVGGFDFAHVIEAYWRGFQDGNADLQDAAIRWLRGEYSTKTEARQDLGVRTIVDDATVYDQIKLLSRFIVLAGYSGLYVVLDEAVNLYKLTSTQARTSNYEQLLRIVNDALQGSVEHLGFMIAGTPEFLTDTRRGVYSYEALQSRLSENRYLGAGLTDYSGPVIRLASLTPEELYVLLTRLLAVYGPDERGELLLPEDAVTAFMRHSSERIGSDYFRTPRTTIRAFVQLLAVLQQNPGTQWTDIIGSIPVEADTDEGSAITDISDGGDELATFRL